jgi:hypothetical protein
MKIADILELETITLVEPTFQILYTQIWTVLWSQLRGKREDTG